MFHLGNKDKKKANQLTYNQIKAPGMSKSSTQNESPVTA